MDFVELTAAEAKSLLDELLAVDNVDNLRKLRVAVDGNHVKFKINEGTWSPPLGKKGEPY